jgi:hypothetical protein
LETSNEAVGDVDPLLPIEVAIDGEAIFEHGNEITAVITTRAGASCELIVRWPDATEAPQPAQVADTRGRCTYTFQVPSSVPLGLGILKGSVREGGRVSNRSAEFQIVANVT